MAHADAFEAVFLIADVDRDGRISGAEAINFFRAADLPQPTLAKIWEFANQGQTEFLSRQEFYNALKLATVAQTGRELTPELVKAALTGPAAAQIPPPRIAPTPSSNIEGTTAPPQISEPTPLQANYGQHFSPHSVTAPDFGLQGSAYPASRRLSSYEGSVAKRHHLQADRVSCVGSVPRAEATWSSLTTSSEPSDVQLSRSVGLSVDSCPQQSSTAGLSTSNAFQNALDYVSNAPLAATAPNFQGGTQFTRPINAGPPNPELHGLGEFSRTKSLVEDMTANCSPRPPSASSTGSLGPSQAPPSCIMTSNPGICGYDGCQLGAAAPAPKTPWPKITPSDAQRFVHVFSQVDTDHDGKVTGEQARQVFLSWQLPREVLRHVWNLSDEDGDSMLSVREFCTAVYLLEKFTEGWPLPSRLPTGIHLDELPTPVTKAFAAEVLGSGESSWRLPQGNMPPTDFMFERGRSSAPECYAESITAARCLQDPLSSGEVALESASCVPHNSETTHANSHFLNQKKESEGSLTPTLTVSNKLVTSQVADLTKHIMSKKEKAEYYRSKLQEIVLFKNQCGNKLPEMTEKVIVYKHEVNTLNQQILERSKSALDVETEIAAEVSTLRHIQEKKRELSCAQLKLDCESRVSDSQLQTQLEHIAVDLRNLRKLLLVRAKSLDVVIKRELSKTPFGWQPNIQDEAAEWEKGWDTFNDDGFTEVQEYIGPTPEASLLAISTGEVSAAASGNVEGESALALDIVDCRLHRELSHEHSSVLESSAASSVSITTTGASTEKSMHMAVYNDKPRSRNETSTDNAMTIHLSTVSAVPAEALTRDAAGTHPGILAESAIETLTTAGVNTFAINVPPSISYSGAESSSEVGSSITSDAFGGNETLWKMGQNDDNIDSALRDSAWDLQSNSRSIQSPAEIKASGRALRSRGSFEPEDYFDLSPPRDLSMPSLFSGSSAMASEHTTNNKSSAGHGNIETFGFLAYTLKESSGSSPIFTTSTTQAPDTLLTDHGSDEHPREELTVFGERQ